MKKINALPTVKAGPKPTGIKLNQHANQLHSKVNYLPATPVLSRIKVKVIKLLIKISFSQ